MPRHRQPISRPLGDHMRHDQNKVRPENRFHRVEDPRMTTELQPGVITGMRLGKIFGSRRDLLILSILIDNHGVRHVPHERIQLGIDPPDLLRIEDFAKKAVASRVIIRRVGIGPIHRRSTKQVSGSLPGELHHVFTFRSGPTECHPSSAPIQIISPSSVPVLSAKESAFTPICCWIVTNTFENGVLLSHFRYCPCR